MKQSFFLSLLASIFVLSSLSIFAQVPQGVNYQAVIRDNSGVSLAGQSVSVRFTIHQTTPAGTVVFQETHATTTNQFGLVNLKIGSVNTAAFPLINWGVGTYFLQVEVDDGSGFDNLGATQLLSVPYALYAKTAGNGPQGLSSLIDTNTITPVICPNGGRRVVMGLDANSNGSLDASEITTSFVVCNGVDGIDGLSINWQGQTATVPSTPNTNDAYYNTTDGISYIYNGTTWDTLAASGSGSADADWVINGTDMYTDPIITGHVGIGTNTPLKKVHVESGFNGMDGVLINTTSASGNPGVVFQTLGTSQYVIGVDQSDANKFKIGVTDVNINTRFTINNQGLIGIGNTNPVHQLTVFSPDTTIASFTGSNPFASVIAVMGINSNAFVGSLYRSGADSAIFGLDPIQKTVFVSNTTPNGHIAIKTDSSVALYGMQVANVGDSLIYNKSLRIYNEVDTIYDFSTNGTIVHANQGMFLTDSLYVLGSNATNPNWILANDGAGQAKWTDPSTLGLGGGLWQSNSPNIYFNTGNVGIGTSTPSSPLTIDNANASDIEFVGVGNSDIVSTNQLNITSNTSATLFEAGQFGFFTASIERFSIANNGNVGIGTNNPSQLFTLSTPASTTLRMERTNASAFDWEMNVDNLGFHLKGGADGTGAVLNDLVNVDGSGKMGLGGITTPTQLLHLLNGTLRIDDGTNPYNLPASDGTISGQVMTTDAAGNVSWQTPASGSLWNLNGSDINYIAGNVGIGTASPLFKLDVDPGASYTGGIARIRNTNPSSTNDALQVVANGSGVGHSVTQVGTGHGQYITVNNSLNTNYALGIATNAVGDGIYINHTGATAGANRNGIKALVSGVGGSTNTGGNFSASGATSSNTGLTSNATASGTAQATGIFASAGGSGTGVTYGVYGQNSSSATGASYGGYFRNMSSASNFIIGVRGDVTGNAGAGASKYALKADVSGTAQTNYAVYGLATGATTNWAGYFAQGNVYVNDNMGIGALNPLAKLHVDNGSGLFNWTNSSGADPNLSVINTTGSSPGFWGGTLGQVVTVASTGTEAKYAIQAYAAGSTGNKYALYGEASGSGAGTTHFGVFGSATGGTTNWAGYFNNGDVFIQNTLVLPTGAGAGKVLTSDAAGNAAWKDKQIAFEVRGSANQNVDNTPTLLQYDAITFDDGGNFNPAAGNYSFKAPVSGVYSFQTNVLFDYSSAGANDITIVELLVNGSPIYKTSTPIVNGERSTNNNSATVKLNATDVVQVRVYVFNGSSIIMTGGADEVWFSGHLVYAY